MRLSQWSPTPSLLAPRPVRAPTRLAWCRRVWAAAPAPPASGEGTAVQRQPAQPPSRPHFSFLKTLGLLSSRKTEEPLPELARRTAQRAVENDVAEELELRHKAALPPPDLTRYLQPVGMMEARYVRMLSSLCAQTYFMNKLTPRRLQRLHQLKLVTTSQACEAGLMRRSRSAQEVISEGDAMAADPAAVREWDKRPEVEAAGGGAAGAEQPPAATTPRPPSPADGVKAAAAALAEVPAPGSSTPAAESSSTSMQPADVVAASLASAASAAAAAAVGVASAAAGAATAAAAGAASAAAPLASNIVTFSSSVTSTLPPVRSVAAQLQHAAASGHSTAVATVAAVSAALDSAWGRNRKLPKECQSPTEWFVADDEVTHTRYFVIQGSDNLDHWRVNLTFDPVIFEDPALGIKVHRGIYEAAQQLYDRFLPLVLDHLAATPFARFAFTGHSLGGSLGTLLMIMFVRRGVLPRSCLVPCYTFGAPSVFCAGAAGSCAGGACGGCSPEERRGGEGGAAAAAAGGVLAALGLPEGAVRNVLMHKDIVPRAFACDYSLVADLLKRVGGPFRDHACLSGQRQIMYNFVGQTLVLQPDEEQVFVGGESYHPMLPPGPGLFLVREPSVLHSVRDVARRDVVLMARAVQQCADVIVTGAPAPGPSASACETAISYDFVSSAMPSVADQQLPDPCCVIGSRAAPGSLGPPPPSAGDALFALMNNPHPLDILADASAYGSAGKISRYHNPDNYTRALGGVIRSRGASWQRLVRHASAAGLRWHAPSLDPAPSLQQLASGQGLGRGGSGKRAARRMLQRHAEAQLVEAAS